MAANKDQVRIAMRHGKYNDSCAIQEASMCAFWHLIPSYANCKSLTIVDYGCSQGANAIMSLERIMSTLPRDATVNAYFEDTPYNDFSTLAETINDGLPNLGLAERNITLFVAMVPVSFYSQVAPTGSVDLGVAWTSLNYLETRPAAALDLNMAPAELMAARRKALQSAAHADLVKLLRLRAAEIRPGGHLLATVPFGKPAHETWTANSGFMLLQAAVRKMASTGVLTADDVVRMVAFPSCERTSEELRAVFGDPDVASLWHVETIETRLIEHPAGAAYRAAVIAAGDDEKRVREAQTEYCHTVLDALISAAGWFWVEALKVRRGPEWRGGDDFLDELKQFAAREFMEVIADMKVETWTQCFRLRRTGSR